ncbi:MAG: sigma-70 family RNA polymerase sigma factor [Planctomycetota bacterium]
MHDKSQQDEFLELLAEHEAQIFSFLYALVCHHEDARDLMQEATMTMWRKFDTFRTGTNFSAWGCEIAKNCALNYFQSRNRRRIFSSTMIDLLAESEASQDIDGRLARRQALRQCVDKLSAKDRELVSQCYEFGTTIKEVAKKINRPAAGVYNSLSRIRHTLFDCIEATRAREERIG